MKEKNMSQIQNRRHESGNAVVVVLVVLLVVAVGALAYLSGQKAGEKKGNSSQEVTVASSTPEQVVTQISDDAEPAVPQIDIKPGNPVVAKLGNQEIKRLDIFNFMQTLPPQTRQLPLDQLFPAALDQVINERVITNKAKDVNLDDDPEVRKQLALAKAQIVRSVYLQNEVNKRVTEERLKQAYEAYIKSFPKVEEVRASHILMDDEKTAQAVLKQVKDGGDFAVLANEYSKDATKENGGDLGYFLQSDVVPEFGAAAFTAEPGSVVPELVKSQFGYHIIKVEDKRIRPPAEFEAAKPFLEAQLRRLFLDQVVKDWRAKAGVERFDINGESLEPTAGDESPAAAE